jgi:hypothetical protein
METRKYTQFGTVIVCIFLPLTLIFAGIFVRSGLSWRPESFIPFLIFLVMLLCLLTFYKLTITIDEQSVSFRLGIGWFGKSYRLADIKSCRPVTNSLFKGFGIRMMSNGWLYNVSGLKAIELRFKNRNSVIRIGCNKPEEISNQIQSLIGNKDNTTALFKEDNKWFNWLWITVIAAIILLVIVPLFKETHVELNPEALRIKGIYGLSIPYNEIIQIDTVPGIPAITLRTNGYALGSILIGNFRLSDKTLTKFFVNKGYPPFLVIRSKNRVPVYINYRDKKKTVNLYNDLLVRHKSLP